MNVLRHTARDFALKIHEMARETSLFDPEIEQRTRAILDAVQKDGDAALLTFTRQFDGADLRADQLAMTQADLLAASVRVDETFRKTIGFAAKNIEQFSRRSLRRGWSGRNAQGAKVGEKYDPFQRVGLYVPGGTAPLVSTVLMTVVLARVAGCPEIVVCTPCGRDGTFKS